VFTSPAALLLFPESGGVIRCEVLTFHGGLISTGHGTIDANAEKG
jgi:hypothetical protein